MTRGRWAAVIAVLVAACSHVPVDAQRVDPRDTFVDVDDQGLLSVNQEPIRIKNANAAIVWFLDPNSGNTFAKDRGIDAGPDFACSLTGNGKRYVCKLATPRPQPSYKYRVTVLDRNGQPLATLDPTIVSNF